MDKSKIKFSYHLESEVEGATDVVLGKTCTDMNLSDLIELFIKFTKSVYNDVDLKKIREYIECVEQEVEPKDTLPDLSDSVLDLLCNFDVNEKEVGVDG